MKELKKKIANWLMEDAVDEKLNNLEKEMCVSQVNLFNVSVALSTVALLASAGAACLGMASYKKAQSSNENFEEQVDKLSDLVNEMEIKFEESKAGLGE